MKNPKDIVKKSVAQYIKSKPEKISLKLEGERSLIKISGEDLNETVEYDNAIDFTSFANGVLDAYRKIYGDLEIIESGLREETYGNDRVSIDLCPTGSAGVFDIFVRYKAKGAGRGKR